MVIKTNNTHHASRFKCSLNPKKFVSKCRGGVIRSTEIATGTVKFSKNHSLSHKTRRSQAPATKSNWSSKGKGCPRLKPNLRFKNDAEMSPRRAPALKHKSTAGVNSGIFSRGAMNS